jgi:hypothetical protein
MSIPETPEQSKRIVCDCGCTFIDKYKHQRHLGTDKHKIMLSNGGDYSAWVKINNRDISIKHSLYTLAHYDANSYQYKTAQLFLKLYADETIDK